MSKNRRIPYEPVTHLDKKFIPMLKERFGEISESLKICDEDYVQTVRDAWEEGKISRFMFMKAM